MNTKPTHRWIADSICIVLLISLASLSRSLAADSEPFDPIEICPDFSVPFSFSGTLQAEGDEAEWVICVPPPELWNGDLVVYAHGTVSVRADPGKIEAILPQLDFAGVSLARLINLTGHAFAVVARSKTGLSVKEGDSEIKRLHEVFIEIFGDPMHTYVVGVSQGATSAVRLLENTEYEQFDGAISACGPIGSFRGQLRYFFDFLVLFEYFFRDELSDNGVVLLEKDGYGDLHVPEEVVTNWEGDGGVRELILGFLEQDTEKLSEVLKVARVPSDPTGETDPIEISKQLLDRLVPDTNDAIFTLGGNPYDNRNRFYFRPNQPFQLNLQLNLGVQRFSADREALKELRAHYETSGRLNSPLIALHTVHDPRVPFLHVLRYKLKSFFRRTIGLYTVLPIQRFGHCEFESKDALAAFALLVSKVTGFDLINPEAVMDDIGIQALSNE